MENENKIVEGTPVSAPAPAIPPHILNEELIRQVAGEMIYSVCKSLVKKEVEAALIKLGINAAGRGLI